MSQDIRLTTTDGIEIAGTYVPGSLPFGVVLLHARPTTKESWEGFARLLNEAGFHTLAIDFRGHGESGGTHYEEMADDETQKSIFDVMAAADFLLKKDPQMAIGLAGASIGANLALQYGAANPAQFLLLLSVGLNYRGIETGRMAVAVPEDLPVKFVTALDDNRVPGNSTQTETLYNACASKNKTIQVFREGGHGTEIIARNPDFAKKLVEWIKESCEAAGPVNGAN